MKKEKTTRVRFLDFARGFAVFSMFLQHCMILHEKTAGEGDTILGNIFVLAGTTPAAPVFMLLLGVFFMKSEMDTKHHIFRGAKLLLLGYLLNLLRFTIPAAIAGTGQISYSPDESPISLLFAVDILQLAGLFLFCAPFLKKYAHARFFLPILIFFVLWLSPFLWGKFSHMPVFAPLWGVGRNVYFPLFPWIVYPLLGMYLSKYLFEEGAAAKASKTFFGVGIGCAGMGFLLSDVFPVGDYYRSGLGIHLVIMGFVFVWLPLCLVASKKISSDNRILRVFFFWSERVTSVYCVQWILFGWSLLIFGENKQSDLVAALIGMLVLILTHQIVKHQKIQGMFSWI